MTGLPVFGPTAAGAALETSKAFSKLLMVDAGVPTARAFTCYSLDDAKRAIATLGAPVVVKASGLAAGKGVIICATVDEANDAAAAMLEQGAFGDAGDTVLVEEFMEGEELSLFVLTDGERVIALPPAQDHKRLLEGDNGPNTGGMGAYSPVSLVERSPTLIDDVLDRVARPTLDAMRARGTPFEGLLYIGLMLTADGPKVVEFNCRFGDPETQAVLPALSSDVSLSDLMHTIARGGLLQTMVSRSRRRGRPSRRCSRRPAIRNSLGAEIGSRFRAHRATFWFFTPEPSTLTTDRWSPRAVACSESPALAIRSTTHRPPARSSPPRCRSRASSSGATSAGAN